MCKNYDYFHVIMPEPYNKLLKFNQEHNSMKIPFVIYENMEFLLKKIPISDSNPEELFTSKMNKHTAHGYSFFTYCYLAITKANMISTEVKTL